MVFRKITSVDDLSLKEISSIVNKALNFQKSLKQKKTNKPKNIFNLFLEASTRTTISFELAAKKLGHNVINVNFEKSSLSKGETFNDTMDTLISMKPDALIIRDKNNFSPHEILHMAHFFSYSFTPVPLLFCLSYPYLKESRHIRIYRNNVELAREKS